MYIKAEVGLAIFLIHIMYIESGYVLPCKCFKQRPPLSGLQFTAFGSRIQYAPQNKLYKLAWVRVYIFLSKH